MYRFFLQNTYGRFHLLCGFLFVLVFWVSCRLYIDGKYEINRGEIHRHASIIAYDLWTLNENNINAYINLAANSGDYKSVRVATIEDDIVFFYGREREQPFDSWLNRLGVMSTDYLSTDIHYKEMPLGTIEGEKYRNLLYPFLNILIIEIIVFLVGYVLFYLANNRKILREQVRERTRRYTDLVDLLPEMVLETDKNGVVVYANQRALELFGAQEMTQLALPRDRLFKLKESEEGEGNFFLYAEEGRLLQTECFAARVDNGALFPVLVSSAPIYSGKNIVEGVRLVGIDMTERRAMEEQLLRDKKMKSIGLMASGVAHDLNNILSGMVNYPDLVSMYYPHDENLLQYMRSIKSSGEEAAAVVSDLLTVARGIAAEKNVVNLNTFIRNYLDTESGYRLQQDEVDYIVHLDPKVDNVFCSTVHLRKCLLNLIANGVESIAGKGTITIASRSEVIDDSESVQLNITSGKYSVISVSDDGSGIAPEHMARIFEPFYSKKEMGRSGTGLGLAIIWNIMQDHGGTVLVESRNGFTRFNLYFPVTDKEPDLFFDKEGNDWLQFQGDQETILIIDDEARQRDIGVQLLGNLNYRVQSVPSGEKALEYLQYRKVDLLLLDMVMHGGMGGCETYEKILDLYPGQKAVIVSGFSENIDVKRTMEMGAGQLLLKPYSKEKLAKAVYQELHK